jgi:ribose transport system substrate-binding protein
MTNAAKLEASKHQGLELLVQAPERATDNEQQIQLIENMITQRVSAICVVPADSKSVVAAIVKANRANIPVLVLDNKVDEETARRAGATIVSFIGSDNFRGGQLAGKFIGDRLNGKGSVAILEGVSGVEAGIQRKAGFLDAIKQYPNIKVVASQPADWDREKGLNVTQSILTANPRLDAIFACNDEMALGAVRASKTGNGNKPVIVGFDAINDALAAVRSGEMAATVAQLPAEVGRIGVATAIEKLQGKNVPTLVPTEVKLISQ